VTISEPQFEQLLEPWLDRAERLIRNALEEFQKHHDLLQPHSSSAPEIKEVILVGGTTRIPAIQKRIQSLFPNVELCTSLNPMSSVAQGLAIQAALQSKIVPLHQLQSALMLDCVPHAIGVELPDGSFLELVARNAPLPARGSATFVLADNAQAGVTIRAVEQIVGSNTADTTNQYYYEPMAKEDFTFLLRRLAPDDDGQLEDSRSIEVGMMVDTDGKFIVSIFDLLDPEQVRKKERFEKTAGGKEVVGELGYIADLVWAEAGTTMEKCLLFGTLIGLVVLYIAVKVAFSELGIGEGESNTE
jgi:molecular chaperone DnaK (HSP70)